MKTKVLNKIEEMRSRYKTTSPERVIALNELQEFVTQLQEEDTVNEMIAELERLQGELREQKAIVQAGLATPATPTTPLGFDNK